MAPSRPVKTVKTARTARRALLLVLLAALPAAATVTNIVREHRIGVGPRPPPSAGHQPQYHPRHNISKGITSTSIASSISSITSTSSTTSSSANHRRFKMAEHTRDVIAEIAALGPDRDAGARLEAATATATMATAAAASLPGWILGRAVSAVGYSQMDVESGVVFELANRNWEDSEGEADVTTTRVTSRLDERLVECRADLDELLGFLYEQFDPNRKLYRELQLTRAVSTLNSDLKFVCYNKLGKIMKKLPDRNKTSKTFPPWGLPFLDATAKPPSAILGGQFQWVGGFEMCNEIRASYTPDDQLPNVTRAVNGKYCRVMIGQRTDPTNPAASSSLSLGVGLCLPDTCATEDVLRHLTGNQSVVDILLGKLGFEVKSSFCGNDMDFETDTKAKLAFGVIMLLVALVSCATVYDLTLRHCFIQKLSSDSFEPEITEMRPIDGNIIYPGLKPAEANGWPVTKDTSHVTSGGVACVANPPKGRQCSTASMGSLISASSGMVSCMEDLGRKPAALERAEAAFVGFSAAVGLRRMCDVTNVDCAHLASVDGMRFLSVIFAVAGNTCLFGILYTESLTVGNLVHKLRELPHQLNFQPIINYSFSADSFLVISGILISYHWLRRVKKAGGKISVRHIIHFYLHRYWSMMPVMMLVLMTYACLYKYLLSGPVSPRQITDAENCHTTWWANLLMVGNLINRDARCLAWTWYVPMLFQLHFITAWILIPYSYKRWIGWFVLGTVYVIFLVAVSLVVKRNTYGDTGSWYYDYLQTPWCRAGPYLIGLTVGIILHEGHVHRIAKTTLTRLLSSLLMVLSVGIIVMLLFITHTKYRKDNPIKWTEDQTISYHVFARSAWGLAVGYIILASETGFGGIAKSLLSHSCMTPPSRLAYPVLITHAILIFRNAYTQYDTIYVNFNNLLYIFLGNLIIVYFVAVLAAIVFYTPFIGLEHAIFGAKTRLDIITAGSCAQMFRQLRLAQRQDVFNWN